MAQAFNQLRPFGLPWSSDEGKWQDIGEISTDLSVTYHLQLGRDSKAKATKGLSLEFLQLQAEIQDESASSEASLKDFTTNTDNNVLKRGNLETLSTNISVTMYTNSSELGKSTELQALSKSRDTSTWTRLIAGYVRRRQAQKALECFEHMQHAGVPPSGVTYSCILKACGIIGAIEKGREIHDELKNQGFLEANVVLGTALMDMYVKCGALGKAECVLEELPYRDVVSWTALMAGYAQEGDGEKALSCYMDMRGEGIAPNSVTYVCILKACASIGAAYKGEQIHKEIVRQGLLQVDTILGTSLVDMYAKGRDFSKAKRVLEELPMRDVVSWNALISGYAHEGQAEQIMNCFQHMRHDGIFPDAITYSCLLKACAICRDTDKGKQIHDEIVGRGLLPNNIMLGTALVDMYAKCGALSKARRVLDDLSSRDVVSWGALITGYAEGGQGEEALNSFECMQCEGISPNAVTYACALKACATIGAVGKGKKIHDEIVSQGLLENNPMLGTALVDMYAKCGAISKAQKVLKGLSSPDVTSWNALIAGYAEEGHGEKALSCFEHMQRVGINPNGVTYASVLKACASLGAADKGKQVHDEIEKWGFLENDLVLGTALVDMYVKCGAVQKARSVLEELSFVDVILWNTLIAGYAQVGQGEQAVGCLEGMQHTGILPDAVTFLSVLKVCSHLGLVEEAHTVFLNISSKYGVKPNLDCYTCMVDLFGRAGHLETVVHLIQEVPSLESSTIWFALLGACEKWADVNVGRWAFDRAVQADKSYGPAYVLLGNVYAAAGLPKALYL